MVFFFTVSPAHRQREAVETTATDRENESDRSTVLAQLREEMARCEQDIATLVRHQVSIGEFTEKLTAGAAEDSIDDDTMVHLNHIQTDWETEKRELIAVFQVVVF